ncbi:MAG: hypothetical protein AAF805_03190 [Planctomycetota bacterium]
MPCECGTPTPVAASQAGGRVTCPACDAVIVAPGLRELRSLPVEDSGAAAGRSGWGFRQGVLAATLLAAAALGGAGWWFWVQEPEPPPSFDPTARQRMVEAGLDDTAPAKLLSMYYDVYRPMSLQGVPREESPQARSVNQKIAWCRMYRTGLWTAAGIVLAVGVTAATLARPPRDD